jgi:hypothetical protein
MRALIPLAAIIALAFAQSAAAATVTLSPVSFSPEFQETLQEDLGVHEGEYLQREVVREVSEALTHAGAQIGPGGQMTIDVAIIDADPNKPTMQQLGDRPGLDWGQSFSIGGAELHGIIRDASGNVLAEIDHFYRTPSIDYVIDRASGQWSDANRTIERFAEKVADAYAANAR